MARKLKAKLDLDVMQAKRRADSYKQSMRGVGKETSGVEKASSALKSTLMGVAGGYLGLAGAQKILTALREETERIDKRTKDAVEAMRGLMALSSMQGMRAEQKKVTFDMAAYSGRPLEEVIDASYMLTGGTAKMSKERQRGIAQKALQFSKTDYAADLSLKDIINLFSTLGTQQPQLTPNQISNAVNATIEQSKSTLGEMSQYLPPVLSAGKASGVPLHVPMAMFSFSTRAGGGVATSGTAVKSAMLGLLNPSDDTAKAMRRYGYRKDASLMEKIRWLSTGGENLPPEIKEELGGRRGLEAIAAIASDPEGFRSELGEMKGVVARKGDDVKKKLQVLYQELPEQLGLDQLRQAKVSESIMDVQEGEIAEQVTMQMIRLWGRHKGLSPVGRKLDNWAQSKWRDISGKPFTGDDKSPLGYIGRLISEGYSPVDIEKYIFPLLGESEKNARPMFMGSEHYDVPDHIEKYRKILNTDGGGPMQGNVNITNQYNSTPTENSSNNFTRTN